MPISDPVVVGQHATFSGVLAAAVVNIGTAVAAGSSLLLGISIHPQTPAPDVTSVTDSKGNTYQVDKSSNLNGRRIVLASAHNVIALTTSDTVTVNLSPSAADLVIRAVWVVSLTGLAATPLDKTADASAASGNNWTVSTAATASAPQIAWWVVQGANTADPHTPGAGCVEVMDSDFGTRPHVTMGYKHLAAAGVATVGGSWTGGGTRSWNTAVATFAEAASLTASLTAATTFDEAQELSYFTETPLTRALVAATTFDEAQELTYSVGVAGLGAQRVQPGYGVRQPTVDGILAP